MLLIRRQQQSCTTLLKRFVHLTNKNNGYIVLVPEIGENTSETILKANGLPEFNKVTIENCVSAVGHQSNDLRKTIENIEKRLNENKESHNAQTIKDIFSELDEATGPLETTWGIAKTLYLANSAPIPTKSYLNIHDKARNAKASKYTNQVIFKTIENLYKDENCIKQLDNEDKRLMEKYLLEGKLNGLSLSANDKEKLSDILNNLGLERTNYKNKVNQAINQFSQTITNYNLIREFPAYLIEATAKDPNQATKGPWKITLDDKIYTDFLKYCPNRNERWNIWQANVRKCSLQSEKSAETSTHLEKIRGLRQRQAEVLGFPNFATMSMQTKMVENIENVKELFRNLLKYAGPAQSAEIEKLQQFANKSGFDYNLDIYDVPFWQRKHLISEHEFNEELFKEYFPLHTVLNGLFRLTENIFGIKIVEQENADVWHQNVKYFDVFESDNAKDPVGGFYLDCYSKEIALANSGYMVGVRNRNEFAKNSPLSALIFNFNSPLYGKPYLLSMSDLKMVFKTFGTSMQHLLTKSKYSDLAGLSNIEWDASQVCGQVLINFLDDPNTLKLISNHYANNEPIPEGLLNSFKLLKQSLAGYSLCQELYLADLDIELYRSNDFWLDVVKRLWPVYRCIPLDKKDAHPCSMTNIISGDWSAAYFSHLYSKVIAADIYEAFVDKKSDVNVTGNRFKETFLASGGSVCTPEIMRRFRGRDVSVEPFLKSLNLLNSSPTTAEY